METFQTTYTTKKEAEKAVSTMNKRYCSDVEADDIFSYRINPLQGYDVYMDRYHAILICDHIDTASRNITMMFNSNNLYDDQEIDELYQERVKLDMLYKELKHLILSWKGEIV